MKKITKKKTIPIPIVFLVIRNKYYSTKLCKEGDHRESCPYNGKYIAKLYQNLTLDIGEPNLTAQLNKVITLFQISDNMAHMWKQFNKLKSREDGQLEQPFVFDEKGHTKESLYKENKLSEFDKSLKKAIDNNPK